MRLVADTQVDRSNDSTPRNRATLLDSKFSTGKMTMGEIKASGKFNGHELRDMPVLNPGDWFGKTWLIEIDGSYWPLFIVVEANSITEAIDELADNEKYGHNIVVDDADLGDYNLDDCHRGPSGQVLDLDHLMIHGQEGAESPFPCQYRGDGLPQEGMKPADYWWREEE
jgi:hypothetical protein